MKRRRNAPDDAVEQPAAETIIVTPVPGRVGPLLHTVTGRVGPLAKSAAAGLNKTAVLVTPYAQRVAPAARTAAGRVGPFAQSAAGRVGPYATQAVGRVSPLAGRAVGLVTPYAQQAQQAAGKVRPMTTSVRQRGAKAAQGAVESLTPKLDGALGRVSPAVEAARGRVTDTLLPRLAEALGAAATPSGPTGATASDQPSPASEVSVPKAAPVALASGGWGRRIGVAAAVSGVSALAAVLVRRALARKDNPWQSAQATTPYSSNMTDTEIDDLQADNSDEPRIDVPATGADFDGSASTVPGVTDESGSADIASYAGEGVYVGAEPPVTFVIKGNERSMKYHTPDSISYVETTAEVWFSSEDAAIANGFTRAHG